MKIQPQHHKAAEMLALGRPNIFVSEELNVTQETVSRWRADFDFQAVLNGLINESRKETIERLRGLSGLALEVVETIIIDPEAPPKDRLQAAFKVLELNKINPKMVGSSDPNVLRKEKEQSDFMEQILL